MAKPSWAPERKSGESDAAYKKRYYTAQRKKAEGDTAAGVSVAGQTLGKIYGKIARSGGNTAALAYGGQAFGKSKSQQARDRKVSFYSEQRKKAESDSLSGVPGSGQTLAKIESKLAKSRKSAP